MKNALLIGGLILLLMALSFASGYYVRATRPMLPDTVRVEIPIPAASSEAPEPIHVPPEIRVVERFNHRVIDSLYRFIDSLESEAARRDIDLLPVARLDTVIPWELQLAGEPPRMLADTLSLEYEYYPRSLFRNIRIGRPSFTVWADSILQHKPPPIIEGELLAGAGSFLNDAKWFLVGVGVAGVIFEVVSVAKR